MKRIVVSYGVSRLVSHTREKDWETPLNRVSSLALLLATGARFLLLIAVCAGLGAAGRASASTTNAFTYMGNTNVTGYTTNDLNAVTTGATWSTYDTNMTKRILADAGASDYGLVFDRNGNATDRYLQFDLTTPADFSSSRVDCRFSTAITRGGSPKAYTIYGFGPTGTTLFKIVISMNTKNINVILTDGGSNSDSGRNVGYIGVGGPYNLAQMTPFVITLDPSATGAELTYAFTAPDGSYSNSVPFLTAERAVSSVQVKITGSSSDAQGFWLDDVAVETTDIPGTTPAFTNNPFSKPNATNGVAYAGSIDIPADVSDPDGDSLSFTNLTGGWLVVSTNGVLSGTPGNADVGTNSFQIRAFDGVFSAVADLLITVETTGSAPAFTNSPFFKPDATQGVAYAGSIVIPDDVSDPDSDSLTFTNLTGGWLSVATNGVLSGTPNNDDVGTNTFQIRVSDGQFTEDSDLQITVINTNDAPVLAPMVSRLTGFGRPFSDTLTASDIDVGDTLTFTKVSGPGWLTIATNGVLGGTPKRRYTGENVFTVRVTDDGLGPLYDEASLTVIVGETVFYADFDASPSGLVDSNGDLQAGTAVGTMGYTGSSNGGLIMDPVSGTDKALKIDTGDIGVNGSTVVTGLCTRVTEFDKQTVVEWLWARSRSGDGRIHKFRALDASGAPVFMASWNANINDLFYFDRSGTQRTVHSAIILHYGSATWDPMGSTVVRMRVTLATDSETVQVDLGNDGNWERELSYSAAYTVGGVASVEAYFGGSNDRGQILDRIQVLEASPPNVSGALLIIR